jgi:hypothetical protein
LLRISSTLLLVTLYSPSALTASFRVVPEVDRGMTFAKLKVKTRGLLVVRSCWLGGSNVKDAERAKAFIEKRVTHAGENALPFEKGE